MPSSAQMVNNPLAVVMDERLSRERALLLTQLVSALRQLGKVELMKSDTPDSTLQQRLAAQPELRLVLPWDRYARSLRLEPADRIAGYFSEAITLAQIVPEISKSSGAHLGRHILLDWNTAAATSIAQIVHWTGLWLNPGVATGMRPLVKPESLIYCENWQPGAGMGFRLDQAQSAIESLTPENSSRWHPHLPRVRSILCDLWSAVYEFGAARAITSQQGTPVAYFQLSGHADLLVFRLQFPTMSTHATEVLGELNPLGHAKSAADRAAHPVHRIYRDADFLRAHFFKENPSVELTVALRWTPPSQEVITQQPLKPLWLAQTPLSLLKEPPFEAPSPQEPRLRVLPSAAVAPREVSSGGDAARDRKLQEAAQLIQRMRGELKQKDELISELRAGGVGTSQPLPPPDAQGLLLAFQQRYFEMNLSIRKLEAQVHQLESGQAAPAQLEPVKRKLQTLQEQEREWLTTLSDTLGRVRSAKAK